MQNTLTALGFLSLLASAEAGPRDVFSKVRERSVDPGLIGDLIQHSDFTHFDGVEPRVIRRTQYDSPYLNNDTQQFVVNGTGVPLINFDIGESYAGLLPISESPAETRELFFWYAWPSQHTFS